MTAFTEQQAMYFHVGPLLPWRHAIVHALTCKMFYRKSIFYISTDTQHNVLTHDTQTTHTGTHQHLTCIACVIYIKW